MAFCLLPSAFCLPPSAYLLLASILVPRAGFEPAQSLDHEILSLARIPISPPRPSHISAACLHAQVCFCTQAWQESLLIRRDALPPVTDKPIKSMSLLHLKRMAIVILKQKN